MNKAVFIATVVGTAIAVTGGAVLARDGHGRGPAFEQIDTNGDGSLSEAEIDAQATARMAEIDTDGDGFLTAAELTEMGRKRSERRVEMMLQRMDTDEDGRLSLEELNARRSGGERFARADTDGDGQLSRAEFDEARAKMRDHRRGHGHGRKSDQDN